MFFRLLAVGILGVAGASSASPSLAAQESGKGLHPLTHLTESNKTCSPTNSSLGFSGFENQPHCASSSSETNFQLNLSYAEQKWDESEPGNLEDLLDVASHNNKFFHSTGKLDVIKDQLKADFSFGYSSSVAAATLEPLKEEDFISQLGINTRVNGKWQDAKYWAEMGFFGSEFTNRQGDDPQDQSGGKVGLEFTVGWFKPKVELERYHDNVASQSDKSQTTNTNGSVSFEVAVPNLPRLTLNYDRQLAVRSSNPEGEVEEDNETDVIGGELFLEQSVWNAFVRSNYTFYRNQLDQESASSEYSTTLGGSYFPIDQLSFTPEVTHVANLASSSHTETVIANLGMSLKPASVLTVNPNLEFVTESDNLNNSWIDTFSTNAEVNYSSDDESVALYFYSGYSLNYDSEGLTNNQTLDFSFEYTQDLAKLLNLKHKYEQQALSVKLNHNYYDDKVSPESSSTETSVFFMFILVP